MSDVFDFSIDSVVENILKSFPGVSKVFLDWGAACPGCGFARFCTLEDVIRIYQADQNRFLEELAKVAMPPNPQKER